MNLDTQIPIPTETPLVSSAVVSDIARDSYARPSGTSCNGEFSILVVDDSLVTRMRLEKLLSSNGYQVSVAEDGLEAINLVCERNIDVILTDIEMPKLGGMTMVRMLRQQHSLTTLPIVMMTSSENREQVLEAFECGANDYLCKPIDNEITLARIKMQLAIKRAQKRLYESEQRYSLATHGTNDGIWDWNLVSGELYLSERWLEMVGADPKWNPTGNEWMDLIHHEDRDRVNDVLESHLCGETDYFETELRMQDRTHEFRWMLCRGLAVKDQHGIAHRIAGSLTDITEGKVADALTGLPNRVLFYDRVERCVNNHNRDSERSFAVIYCDVDDFKLINDKLGHEVGDQFLVEVSNRLTGSLNKVDAMVARLGGDEFAVLIEKVSNLDDVVALADVIHSKMKTPFKAGSREVVTRASMGIVFAAPKEQESDEAEKVAELTTEQLISRADAAMYRAKKQAMKPYCVFESHMLADNQARLELRSDMRNALKSHELSIHYQPIINIESRQTLGFEALVRWNHPIHGNVPPSEFIPIAESNGVINEIGAWVLKQACIQTLKWNQQFHRDLMVSVNVSASQLLGEGFVAVVERVLEETGLSATCLRLEITESLLMNDSEEIIKQLLELREKGIKISLDDFGTGYSSLSYLHRIPMDVLKIDRSFVQNMNDSKKNLAIIRSIIALASSLDLQIVAEGVERTDHLTQLEALGVHFAQGYLLSRPVPPSQADALIDRCWSNSQFSTD